MSLAAAYFPWNPTDYLRISVFLTAREDLVLRRLIDLAWMSYEGRLPRETDRLAMEIRLETDWFPEVEKIVRRFFVEQDDALVFPWLQEKLERVAAIRDRNRENGAKGGRPGKPDRKGTKSERQPKRNRPVSDTKPTGSPDETQSKPTGTLKEKEKEKEIASSSDEEEAVPPSRFEASARALAEHLREEIHATKPDAKLPEDLAGWAEDFERMLRLDKRDADRAKTLVTWARGHRYWGARIFSAESFRKFYDQIDADCASHSGPTFRRASHQRAKARTDYAGGF